MSQPRTTLFPEVVSMKDEPVRRGWLDQSRVGVWGVQSWSARWRWGAPDPRRDPLLVDRYGGTGYWGRHAWGTDRWLRWEKE